jgi:hypothetical protein
VLWRAWVDRFSGRRLAAALSFVIIPLIGYVGWRVESAAVGITAAAGMFGCFAFLVAFAMAHREVKAMPASPTTVAPAPSATEPTPIADLDDGPASGGPFTRFAN